MHHNTRKWGSVLMVVVMAEWMGTWGTLAIAQKARVEQTGQTECFDTSGNLIICEGTGQDGDILAGVPFPKNRFIDKGDGTAQDKLTKLIWLKQADCFPPQPWVNALQAANILASGACGLTDGSIAGDWRMPNVKELQSLIDFSAFDPAFTPGHPFSGVQSSDYFTSTSWIGFPASVWFVRPFDGLTVSGSKGGAAFLLPVRGGGRVATPSFYKCPHTADSAIVTAGRHPSMLTQSWMKQFTSVETVRGSTNGARQSQP